MCKAKKEKSIIIGSLIAVLLEKTVQKLHIYFDFILFSSLFLNSKTLLLQKHFQCIFLECLFLYIQLSVKGKRANAEAY